MPGARLRRHRDDRHPGAPAYAATRCSPSLAFLGVALIALVFDKNIGFVAITAAVILAMLSPNQHKDAVKQIAWPTVLLVAGVSTYATILTTAGSPEFVGDWAAGLGAAVLGALVLCYVGGVVSAFASSTALLPVIIPIALPLIADGGISAGLFVAALAISSTIVDVSPFSTNGALMLANRPDTIGEQIYYKQILTYSVIIVRRRSAAGVGRAGASRLVIATSSCAGPTERAGRPAGQLTLLAELGVHPHLPALAVDVEHGGRLGPAPLVRDQRERRDASAPELAAQVHLGGLHRERVRRAAAQVVEVEPPVEVCRGEPRGVRRLEPSVVEAVREHQHVGREPVAADVGDLPGLLGRRLRPAPRRAAGRARRSRRRAGRGCRRGTTGSACRVQPSERPPPSAGQVEVEQLVDVVELGGLQPRPLGCDVRREDRAGPARRPARAGGRAAAAPGCAPRARRGRSLTGRRAAGCPGPRRRPRGRASRRAGTPARSTRCPPAARRAPRLAAEHRNGGRHRRSSGVIRRSAAGPRGPAGGPRRAGSAASSHGSSSATRNEPRSRTQLQRRRQPQRHPQLAVPEQHQRAGRPSGRSTQAAVGRRSTSVVSSSRSRPTRSVSPCREAGGPVGEERVDRRVRRRSAGSTPVSAPPRARPARSASRSTSSCGSSR